MFRDAKRVPTTNSFFRQLEDRQKCLRQNEGNNWTILMSTAETFRLCELSPTLAIPLPQPCVLEPENDSVPWCAVLVHTYGASEMGVVSSLSAAEHDLDHLELFT